VSDFENLDHYELLGVSRAATPEEIKRAYRQEMSKYHPDRFANASPQQQEYASRRSQRITEAYGVLSDMTARAAYNRGQSPRRAPARRPTPASAQPRDHQAELYEQARDHLAADRPLQAIGALRQLQQVNPFYRDAAELLARAEAQLQARQRRISQGGSRRPLFIVGGLAGGAAIVALIALAVGLSRGASNTLGAPGAPTAVAAIATDAPTEPPLPSISSETPQQATSAPPTQPAPTEPATSAPEPSATPAAPNPTAEPPAATPPPAAPSPVAEAGAVVLADAFSSGGWANSSSDGWRVGYQGGRYRVAVDAGYGTIWSYRTAPIRDYSLGVDIQVPSGEGGVLLRFVDARNYLSFSINPAETSYRLEQHSGGAVRVLAGGQSEAIANGPDAINRLVARLTGNHVELLSNGQRLADLDLSGASDSTRFGLLAVGGTNDSVALFDNLQIRQLEN
jgi:DnaJ-domain-containing protein 1